MGRDKAFLDIDGKPLIRRSIEALQEVCAEVMIVGGIPNEGGGVPWHRDFVRDCGPLGGIYTALKLTGSDVVIAACDLPNVNGGLIRFLISHHEAHKAAITIPRAGEILQPLLGIYGSFSSCPW